MRQRPASDGDDDERHLDLHGTAPRLSYRDAPSTCAFGSVSRWDGTQWNCDSLTKCPPGYSPASDAVSAYCTKTLGGGQNDEMVKVGDFWIDRFEMSARAMSTPDTSACGNLSTIAGNNDGYGATDIGCSVSGVHPQTSLTWFLAAQMCANAGKELCTNAQWQTAVSGTPDPGAWPDTTGAHCGTTGVPGDGQCNTCSMAIRNAGLGSACVSSFGAEDMIGNMREWTAEWWQVGPTIAGFTVGQVSTPWPTGYGDNEDYIENMNGTVDRGGFTPGLPAAALCGGDNGDGSSADAFTIDLRDAPTDTNGNNIGARCCFGGR